MKGEDQSSSQGTYLDLLGAGQGKEKKQPVKNLSKVYANRRVCQGFSFLSVLACVVPKQQSAVTSCSSHQETHSCRTLTSCIQGNLALLQHSASFTFTCLLSNELNSLCSCWKILMFPTSAGNNTYARWTLSSSGPGFFEAGCIFLQVSYYMLHLCLSVSGMYLSDLTYIDSAYPSTGSILENEQRSNLMNNILRIISDLQRSCTYGEDYTLSLRHAHTMMENKHN